jgi:hypothetical protein
MTSMEIHSIPMKRVGIMNMDVVVRLVIDLF